MPAIRGRGVPAVSISGALLRGETVRLDGRRYRPVASIGDCLRLHDGRCGRVIDQEQQHFFLLVLRDGRRLICDCGQVAVNLGTNDPCMQGAL